MAESAHRPARLDHLLWAVPDRAAGIADLERRSGVRAAIGGAHPGEGTHNALAHLTDRVYLEIIAPDPGQPSGGLARKISHVTEPSLELWAVRTHSAEATAEAASAAGLTAESVAMGRKTADGRDLRWKLVWIGGHDFGPLVPFFIDWLDTEHPAPQTPKGLDLASFQVESPRADALTALLEDLGVEQDVRMGATDRLVADLRSPRGMVRLTGPFR